MQMRYSIFLLLALLVSVGRSQSFFEDSTSIATYGHQVSRSGDTLTLRFKNKSQSDFISEVGSDGYYTQVFTFDRYLQKSGFFVLRQSWQDGDYQFLLVRDRDGYSFSILDSPILSPNGRYFAMASLENGLSENALEVCQFIEDSVSLMYTTQPKDWGPSEIRWISNDSLLVLKSFPADSHSKVTQAAKALLVMHKSMWFLKDYYK